MMAKTKNKRKLADKTRSKKSATATKINPFEVKINRQKHDVLGKKFAKHDRGMPGVARCKAVNKRKETLLVEYKKRGKNNKFIDRRFGETNPEISLEDKMLQRFTLERQRTHEKSNLFNLNEDEDLTHYGQSLSEIEKCDEPVQSDDEDDDDQGRLGADIVGQEHFGGFLTKKDMDEDEQKKSWKERMEEIIASSKKKKFERKSEKDKTTQLTEELDSQWKELMHVMSENKRNKNKDSEVAVKKVDDYDKMVRELQFEIKGQASERLKTEEEIAKEEKERLEKLEADRLRRMRGLTTEQEQLEKSVYRSADDLDDGFDLGGKQVRFEVAYDDGKLVAEDDSQATGGKQDKKEDEEEDDDDDGDSNDDDDDDDDDDECDDSLEQDSDLNSSDEDLATDEFVKLSLKPVAKSSLKKPKLDPQQEAELRKKQKQDIEAAKKELPYTFKAPESYEDMLDLLQEHSDADQLVLIERFQKLYHPSLAEGNNDKLQRFYTLLVEYYCDLAVQDPPLLTLLDGLVKPLYQLTQRYPQHAATTWIELIVTRHEEFTSDKTSKATRGHYPSLDMLLAFKLISRLFPTSDFKHPVVTPAMLFITEILSQSSVQTPLDVASGLLLTAITLQYVSLSKRFVPEALNFLQGLLFTASEKDMKKIEAVSPPFKPVGKHIDLLKLSTKCKSIKNEPVKISDVFSSNKARYLVSDGFKVQCMYQCLSLISSYMDVYSQLPSYREIFLPHVHFMDKLPLRLYPDHVKALHSEVLNKDNTSPTLRTPLVMPKQRPKPLKMFEPKFEEVFDGKKKRAGSRETQDKQRLVHKYKKELKGTVRNLRQDNLFLAREKLNEQIDRDAERKRKVNQLFQDLASQEGDYKAMKRAKDKN